jgi:serine protease Do
MKFKLLCLPALILGFSPICQADDADKERIKELERKMAELQSQKAAITTQSALFDEDGKVNTRISNSVLIIEGDKTVGTGFIVSAEGKKFVYTAAHVFSGNNRLAIKNSNGTSFKKFGDLEAAEGADLVRLELLEEVKDFLELFPADSALQINTEIAALGNGGGNGVVSVEEGKVLGTSGDTLEVDAGIIQGNSGGPVVEQSSGKAVGLVTHLTSERKDIWSEGTRQAEVRRFACRLNKEWKWKPMKIGVFLAEGKAVVEFDDFTRLCFAMLRLQPLENGLRLDTQIGSNANAMEVIQKNNDNELVKTLIRMNTELATRKTSLSDSDLKKKFRSLLAHVHSQAGRTNDAYKPQNFAWFHRNRAQVSVKARKECLDGLSRALENLK